MLLLTLGYGSLGSTSGEVTYPIGWIAIALFIIWLKIRR